VNLLPVRPAPVPGEDLCSLAERTARANRLNPTALGITPRMLIRCSPEPAMLTQLGVALDLTPGVLHEMTPEVYPREVVGTTGTRVPRRWRVSHVRWACPRCTPRAGIYLRDWQLALHPLCTSCPSLLYRTDRHLLSGFPTPDRQALTEQHRIVMALHGSRRDDFLAEELRRLYNLVLLVALTADHTWPPLSGWEAELREALPEIANDWTRVPPNQPAQAAAIVFECARVLPDGLRCQRLVDEALERLAAAPSAILRRRRDNGEGLELRFRAQHGEAAADDMDRLQRLLGHLEDLRWLAGLNADHIPALPPRPVRIEFSEPDLWWVDLTTVSHMLLTGLDLDPTALARTQAELGVTSIGRASRRLALGYGIAAGSDRWIGELVQDLVDAGLVDFADRRRRLAVAPLLVGQLRRHFSPATGWPQPPADEVLHAWAWIAFARSPPRDTDLHVAARSLDEGLNPEHRLVLHETVLAYLDDVSGPDTQLALPIASSVAAGQHGLSVVA